MSELEPRASITAEEARELTQRARESLNQTGMLFLATYETGAWDALRYSSWLDYAVEEFKVSKSRAYQMLDHAEVVREISGSSSTMVDKDQLPNERQTRELAKVPEGERAEVWQKVVDITDGRPTAAAIREALAPVPTPVPARDPFTLPEIPQSQEATPVVSQALADPRISPEEAEQRRRERVATDLLTSVLVPLSQMAYSDGFRYYRPEIATPHPLSASILDRCQTALDNIRAELQQKGLL